MLIKQNFYNDTANQWNEVVDDINFNSQDEEIINFIHEPLIPWQYSYLNILDKNTVGKANESPTIRIAYLVLDGGIISLQ